MGTQFSQHRASLVMGIAFFIGCQSSDGPSTGDPQPRDDAAAPGSTVAGSPDARAVTPLGPVLPSAPDATTSAPDRASTPPALADGGPVTTAPAPDGGPADQMPTSAPSLAPTLAFVGGDNGNVYVFEFDPATCELTRKNMIVAAKPAWYGAIDSKNQRLYIGSLAEGKVLAYAIDRAGARLTLINSVAVAGSPAHVALDRSNKFLFVAAFEGGNIVVLPIRSDGGLGDGTTLPVGKNPHSTATDPGNRYLFVQNMGSDTISQFSFDPQTGRLSPMATAQLMLPAKTGPRSGAFHPKLPYYYTANELGNSVTTYAVETNGSLRVIETKTVVPMGFMGTNYAAEIKLSPSGNFAYVSNRGADTIAVFGIDGGTGKLTELAQTPVGARNPQAQSWDSSGQRFLSANTSGRTVVCFAVDPQTGALTKKTTTMLDTLALWVGVLH